MTDVDLMPFGKYKGTPMGSVPKDYLGWLLKQEGFADKNKAMAKYIRGEPDAASPKELDNLAVSKEILAKAPPSFVNWWSVAYGERLRKDGELHYIGYLRVALEAWLHCTGIHHAAQPPPPCPPTTFHTPKEVDLLRAALPARKGIPATSIPVDEEVQF